MNTKNMQIIVILIVVVIAVVVVLGFFGVGGLNFFPQQQAQDAQSGPQALLNKVQETGSITQLESEDITVGTGDPVVAGDTVSVLYTGVLPNGTVFDSTDSHGGTPFTFTVGTGYVIKGWDQGLLGMKEGGRRLLAIPSDLAYGAAGQGPIPPNATLIFDIQLVKRVPAGTAPTTN